MLGFNVPLLVCHTTENYRGVYIPIGTSITDLVINSLDISNFKHASQSQKAVYNSTQTRRKVQSQEVQVGIVTTTKSVILQPFSTTSVHGFTKVKGHRMRLNLIAETIADNQLPSGMQCTPLFAALNQVLVESGWVRNVSAKKIIFPAIAIICQVQSANMVPKLYAPVRQLSTESKQGEDTSWMLKKLGLGGLKQWTEEQQQAAKDILCKLADIF